MVPEAADRLRLQPAYDVVARHIRAGPCEKEPEILNLIDPFKGALNPKPCFLVFLFFCFKNFGLQGVGALGYTGRRIPVFSGLVSGLIKSLNSPSLSLSLSLCLFIHTSIHTCTHTYRHIHIYLICLLCLCVFYV